MKLPDNWTQFKKNMLEKIKMYCNSNIWPFPYSDVTAWLKNFDEPIEEYLALQILDSLIVRTSETTKASYSSLFNSKLRQTLIEEGLISNMPIAEWKMHLKKGSLNRIIQFSPVRKPNDEGESGSTIFRMLSEDLHTDRYSSLGNRHDPRVIVLIDDIIGSGTQFVTGFSESFDLANKIETKKIIYCPLIAFEEGIENIKSKFPDICMMPAEYIYKSDSIFYGNDNDLFRNDKKNTVGEAKIVFNSMREKYWPSIDINDWYGHESACLPVVFEWGCPNQAPRLLWWQSLNNDFTWHQLFSRRS